MVTAKGTNNHARWTSQKELQQIAQIFEIAENSEKSRTSMPPPPPPVLMSFFFFAKCSVAMVLEPKKILLVFLFALFAKLM